MKLTPVTLPPGRLRLATRPSPDRVAPGHKDDRHRRGCGLGRERRRGIGDDQGYLPAKKVRHQKRQPSLILARVDFDRDILALDEARFLQALAERSHAFRRHVSERFTAEKPHHRHRWLLRARDERPRRCTAEQRYERASPHGRAP
jgi:hypothetical protein